MDYVDPAMVDQAPPRARMQIVPRSEVRDYTVTFYVDSIKPSAVPTFTYFVSGSAAGRVRMTAYVPADCPAEAQIRLLDYFAEAYIECVEVGRVEQPVPSGQGVVQPERRPGILRRLFGL